MHDHHDITDRRRPPRVGWRGTWFGEIVGRLWYLIAYSNTTQTRFFLALTASFWAGMLAIPGDSFSRPQFGYMRAIAPEGAWMLAFVIYAGATYWRVFADTPRPMAGFVVNGLGLVLFAAVAVSIGTLPITPVPAGAAAHFTIALAALWVFVRTNINSPKGWRNDA